MNALQRYGAPILAAAVMTLVGADSARATTITFSEFAAGTIISDQYAAQGVTFTTVGAGRLPIIANDFAMPGSPVLSPNPPYSGAFGFDFGTGADGVIFDSGYWDAAGTAAVQVFSPSNVLLATLTNTGTAVFTFNLSGLGTIGRVTFNSTADAGGGDIDNLSFRVAAVPEPATIVLLGSGLLLARRRARRAVG